MLITRQALETMIVESLLDRNIFDLEIPSDFPTTTCRSASGSVLATNDLSGLDADSEVLYYHPIKGTVFVEQYYGWKMSGGMYPLFSTRAFIKNLQEAERSSNVTAHFLHVNSPGGEAWLIEKASEAMKACRKPIYAFIEANCCSAAYWLASHAHVLKAYTDQDSIGSIGSMVYVLNFSGYYEELGIKEIEEYATKSDLKNKRFNDLMNGNPKRYIEERLDPLQEAFEQVVRSARPQLDKLPDDHAVFRGETFLAGEAIALGLIDGMAANLSSAMMEAYDLGQSMKKNNNLLTNL